MDDSFKRPNKLTGKPFQTGFEDEDGRVLDYKTRHLIHDELIKVS